MPFVQLDIQKIMEIAASNPNVDPANIAATALAVKILRESGIRPKEYGLATILDRHSLRLPEEEPRVSGAARILRKAV